jgi:hypothetical protein
MTVDPDPLLVAESASCVKLHVYWCTKLKVTDTPLYLSIRSIFYYNLTVVHMHKKYVVKKYKHHQHVRFV